MSWVLPVPLLLFAAAVALLPLMLLVRWPTSTQRPVAKAFISALAVSAAFWLGWVALWLIAQRWRGLASARSWRQMTLRVPPARPLKRVSIPPSKGVNYRTPSGARSRPVVAIAPGSSIMPARS